MEDNLIKDADNNWILDSVFNLELITTGLSYIGSLAMIFGGLVPYIPQFRDIKRTENAEGFSLFVCLALLLANTMRILFWFGHRFELPLLLQSIVMNVAMFAMVHLCVRVKHRTQIVPVQSQIFTDFDLKYFWAWTDFLSYLECVATFSAAVGAIVYLFIEEPYVIETIGLLALLTEAGLGVPQFYTNFKKKSTLGMSKKMVFMWTAGDIFKTTYFVLKRVPRQFWICSTLQITIDLAILFQIVFYQATPIRPLLKPGKHIS